MKTSKTDAALHEAEVWALKIKRYSAEQIAERVGLSVRGVWKILARVRDRLKAHSEELAARERDEQLDALDWVAQEAAQSWEKSKEAIKSATKRTVNHPGGEGELPTTDEVVTHHVAEQTGAVSYLAEYRSALADRRGILGVDAAKKMDVTSSGVPYKIYLFDPEIQVADAANPSAAGPTVPPPGSGHGSVA